MRPSELVWTFVLSFVGILGINTIVRVVIKGWDMLLDFSWPGVVIAAGIAALITLRRAGRGPKSGTETPDADGQS